MTREALNDEKYRRYAARLRRSLGALEPAEVDDILLEIDGHVAERLGAATDPPKELDAVLEALGDPEELAAAFHTEALYARGRASPSPLAVLGAVQRWATEGLIGLISFLLGLLGYGLAGGLVALAVLKPILPRHVGLWWDPPELLVMGLVNGPPDPSHELLGWTLVPLALVAGGLLWLATTRLLRGLLRAHRKFVSPLPDVGGAR